MQLDISIAFSLKIGFQWEDQDEGVRRSNIYLLRLVFFLMFFVLGRDCHLSFMTANFVHLQLCARRR